MIDCSDDANFTKPVRYKGPQSVVGLTIAYATMQDFPRRLHGRCSYLTSTEDKANSKGKIGGAIVPNTQSQEPQMMEKEQLNGRCEGIA